MERRNRVSKGSGFFGIGSEWKISLTSTAGLPQEIKSNKTVLHLAVQAANPTLVQLLLELPRGDLRTFVNMKVGAWAGCVGCTR